MVEEFQRKHGKLPEKIVVAPVALMALGLKRSLAPTWEGVPVECRLFADKEVASDYEKAKVRSLGLFVKENRGRLRLVACDLK
jgi:hypothetical protein